ncbi:related to Pre-mRNA cleavage complex II protein Clp1 [Sporisorium reilianum SRZ2]|uniref:Polynucleotide 5'-hydroxyl-kinase GRC3 n=2 Tax=Sporisorium reilianum TaxID=72558 RepID=E7A1W5_SPORE|nr:related to Pre-mRNA cleavage complex II protein Clp1 [Sporisorium reilianum SRZ2]SJX63309.1 related to Pre-mRNA cleavage complex II protein Clp1 [Sporisorium reilianum f. sp. reilianum]
MDGQAEGSSQHRRVFLPPRSEYRFELEPHERLSIRLVQNRTQSGDEPDAEIFGAELVGGTQERWYPFGDEAKAAVSSWRGAEIEIAGSASTEYLADEPSPVYTAYSNLHLYLERKRILARQALRADAKLLSTLAGSVLDPSYIAPRTTDPNTETESDPSGTAASTVYRPEGQGPRVMVLGPESAGKTSLVKFLANYALRSPAVASLGKGEAGKVAESLRSGGDGIIYPNMEANLSEEAKKEKREEAKKSDITGWWPVVVNLDPSDGAPPLPCCLSALPLSPLPLASLPSPSPAFAFGTNTSTTGAIPPGTSTAHGVAPLSLWLGKENVRDNERHFRRVVDWLAEGVERRLARDFRSRMSGLIIDTPGVVTADARTKYAFVQHCVKAFKVDTIVVLGHEKLNLEMTKLFGSAAETAEIPGSAGAQRLPRVNVIKLPKSGGVVELDETYRARLKALQVKTYFYGGSSVGGAAAQEGGVPKVVLPGHADPLGGVPSLSPYSTTIPFDLLEIYRVGQESLAPSSALPIGASRTVTETQLVKMDPTNSAADQTSLLHSVLALIQPPRGGGGAGQPDSSTNPTDDEIIGAPILGFVHVADIDTVRKKITVLSPSTGRLPSKTAILGTLDWQDV